VLVDERADAGPHCALLLGEERIDVEEIEHRWNLRRSVRYGPLCGRVDADVARFRPEPRPVVDRQPGLILPLVNHLVDEGVDDLLPPVPTNVTPTDRDLPNPLRSLPSRSTGPPVHLSTARRRPPAV
jgi:hypothetical protein